jgi:hypothetical protein
LRYLTTFGSPSRDDEAAMNRNLAKDSAFFEVRVFVSFLLLFGASALAITGFSVPADAQSLAAGPATGSPPKPGRPDSLRLIGPFAEHRDLRDIPYAAPNMEEEEVRLMRHPLPMTPSNEPSDQVQKVREFVAAISMPTPIASFPGLNSVQSGCGCVPPDPQGDVGPNHYIQSVNSSVKIFDKAGNELNGPNGTTYNSFFSGLAGSGTPCGLNQNEGDGIVFYDHLADRWVVSDFAFPAFPSDAFYQCIGVSQTSDPVAGGWWLYAIQVDPANPTVFGDYPKFGLWPDAYYVTMNLFASDTTFSGVRVIALDRASMINGTAAPNPTAVAFTISPATLGDAYSLVPATFRTGLSPPAGTPEFLLAIDSPPSGGVLQNAVHVWRFHVDFATPANSTLGLGADHAFNGNIAVNSFTDAFTTTTLLVPQNGTSARLDTLGDKIMAPLVYQNLGGVESLWASHTVNNNVGGTGPTAIRWYQFDVTGSTIPAAPVQQQTFNNSADGLWRWMPSLAVDALGNMAISYSASSSTSEPSIRYAGRLAADAVNTLGQGEAILIAGGGHQTNSRGRWGDYSSTSIDPSDNLTFWASHEYFASTSSLGWATRIGSFKFLSGIATPTPTPSPTATAMATTTPTPTPTSTAIATATFTPTPTATASTTPTATATTTATATATAAASPTATATATATASPPSEVIYGMTTAGSLSISPGLDLVWFNSDTPGAINHVAAFSGITEGQNLRSVDFRPSSGVLYAISTGVLTAQLYTVDLATAVCSPVGNGFPLAAILDARVEIDFDPVADVIRVITGGLTGNNLRVDPETGGLIATDADLAYAKGDPLEGHLPSIVGAAYSNNVAGASSTTLYAWDFNFDSLVTIGGPDGTPSPDTGQLFTIDAPPGLLRFNGLLGMDISGVTGTLYVTHDNPADGTRMALYKRSTSNGAETLIGDYPLGTFIGDISVQPVGVTPTATPTATAIASPIATATPTATARSTPTVTATSTPVATATASATPESSPTATATATPTPSPGQALNLSSRLQVGTGDKLMIGGFIIDGNAPKKVVLRGIGPHLAAFGITDFLADPFLELRTSSGALLQSNDNWKDTQRAEIEASGLAPSDDRESAIIIVLAPGSYTALLTGHGGTTGVGLVEVYDADAGGDSQLGNVSTRGFVQTGNNVLIAGFILGGDMPNDRTAVRGLGPSLSQFGLNAVLADPILELHDGNGATLIANDDWQSDPVSAANLTLFKLAPANPKEPAIFTSLPPGTFTAILAGKDGASGIGVLEVYTPK